MNQPASHKTIHEPACWLEKHYHQVDAALRAVASRKGLNREESVELTSDVHLHLVERDYAVPRAWDGSAAIQTYLYSVITRKLVDFIRGRKGRRRPSRRAERLGEVAVLFEELFLRQGKSFDEACLILTVNHGFKVDRDELARLAVRLRMPVGPSRSEIDPENLDSGRNPEDELDRARERSMRERVLCVLEQSGSGLNDQESLLIKLKFEENLPLSKVARMLGLSRAQAEHRLMSILNTLRQRILESGVSEEDLRDWLNKDL